MNNKALKGFFLLALIFLLIGFASAANTHNDTNIEKDSSNTQITKNTTNNIESSTDNRIATKIQVDKISTVEYTDNVTITGKAKTANSNPLSKTTLKFDINGAKRSTKTDTNGTFQLKYKTNIVGINNVTISFTGNSYFKGTDINKSFTVKPKTTKVTINKIKSTQYTDKAVITGNYKDNNGRVIRNTTLTLKLNGKQYSNKTDADGYYTFNIKTTKVGNNTLTVSYLGNIRYKGASTSKNFTVTRKDTKFTVNNIPVTQYTDMVTVTGRYTDASGNNLRYTPISVKIHNDKYTTTTNNEGVFTLKAKTSKIGTNTVTVSYLGNDRYNKASKTTSFNVTPKATRITLTTGISSNMLTANGRFTDTNGQSLRYTPVILEIEHSNFYVNNNNLIKTKVTTDGDGFFKYNYNIQDSGTYTVKVTYYGNSRYCANTTKSSTINKGQSKIYLNSLQATVNQKKSVPININDELNNTVKDGKLSIYINNNFVQTINASNINTITLPAKEVGVYDLKAVFTSKYYVDSTKTVKLTVNPVSDYTIELIWSPVITHNQNTKLSASIHNKNKKTVNTGTVRFYLNNKYMGYGSLKDNITKVRFNATLNEGYYPAKAEYYINNKFIGADSNILYVHPVEAQKAQNTFITMAGDLAGNSLISSNKKDVYFAMDRTTIATYNYSPNDMKIMNSIAYNLRMNGFNVKTIRNGPGETYNTPKYMYDHKVRNSICFILCNGVDANCIRQYLKGNDAMITAMRNRGNDMVLGWFYGAGNFYDPDSEYYYYLEKAWDDNYSGKGGIANPRRTMERDGIKIIYQRNDLTGQDVANSLIKMYGGKMTSSVSRGSTLLLKTSVYNTQGNRINSGNIVYTLNGKIIKNVTVTSGGYNFRYTMPKIAGTYNLKATYYKDNKPVCQTWDRYIKVI